MNKAQGTQTGAAEEERTATFRFTEREWQLVKEGEGEVCECLDCGRPGRFDISEEMMLMSWTHKTGFGHTICVSFVEIKN